MAEHIAGVMPDETYGRVYAIRERLSDYLEGPRSLREAERHISDAIQALSGLEEDLLDANEPAD